MTSHDEYEKRFGRRTRFDDRVDTFIERWLGTVLIVGGVVALGLSIAGLARVLPEPFAVPYRPDCIGCREISILSQTLMYGGFWAVAVGWGLVRHFRRQRRRDRTEHARSS